MIGYELSQSDSMLQHKLGPVWLVKDPPAFKEMPSAILCEVQDTLSLSSSNAGIGLQKGIIKSLNVYACTTG